MTISASNIQALNEILQSSGSKFDAGASTTATRILDSHNTLGECIIYDDRSKQVLWTDIEGKEFHSLEISTGSHSVIQLPKMLCAFGLREEGPGYLFCWEDGFQLYDVENGVALSEMSEGEDVNPNKLPTRLNDGRCCPSGKRFICGGFYGEIEGMYMKVYKVEGTSDGDDSNLKLKHEAVADKFQVTNSICWSPDGKTQYLADSPTETIFKYDYCQEKGVLSNRQVFRKLDVGVPDGSCNDADGNLWNAVWRNGAGQSHVQCTNPAGEVIYTVNMPENTSQLTCCCFGGPDLDVLFISSAHVNRDRAVEQHAGCVYAVKLAGVKGRAETRLRL
jgi:L-arabinonolactonase